MITIFNSFTEAMAEAKHNLGSDTLQYVLSNTLPLASNTVLTDITQISGAGGYAPIPVTVTSSSQSGGVYTLELGTASFTASGADFDPFRYIILYNDTAANDELIGWIDIGSSFVLPDGTPYAIAAGDYLTIGLGA